MLKIGQSVCKKEITEVPFFKGFEYEIHDIIDDDDNNKFIMVRIIPGSTWVFSLQEKKDYQLFSDYFIMKKDLLNKKLTKIKNV